MKDITVAATSRRRAAVNRLVAGAFGVTLTTVIGTTGVLAVYYPLRDADTAVQGCWSSA